MHVTAVVPEYRRIFPAQSFLSRDTGRLLVIALRMHIDNLPEDQARLSEVINDSAFNSESYDDAAVVASENLFGWFNTLAMYISRDGHSHREILSIACPTPQWTPSSIQQIDKRFQNAWFLQEEIRESFLKDITKFLQDDTISSSRFTLRLSRLGRIVLVSKPNSRRTAKLRVQ